MFFDLLNERPQLPTELMTFDMPFDDVNVICLF